MKRQKIVQNLKSIHYDILVIGGGATGTGIALDAASRGLKVALVERDDFASGTSSRSTKLIHGGVRYLEQAFKKLDRGQYNLVKDALHERATLIRLAPHLAHPLPLVTPVYTWWGIPYYLTGLKLYDFVAGKVNLSPSRRLRRQEALKRFPMLKKQDLKGGILYYDGQFDDARMNIALALTAIEQGADVLNHIEILNLTKENKHLTGALVQDHIDGETFTIKSRCIINATGPFADNVRLLDDPKASPLLKASSGIHLILSRRFSPPATGLLIPKTEDGRVLFLLPWLGYTLVGTTDNPAPIEDNPKPSEADVAYILRHIEKYFDVPVNSQDVLAVWSGLRPLVSDPGAADTAKLSRDHVIHISASGLLTIVGGKWTTYRKMALDAVDQAVKLAHLKPARPCQTEHIPLTGAEGFSPLLASQLREEFHLPDDIATHLASSYGGHARSIASQKDKAKQRLVKGHPLSEAEVVYAIEKEMAQNAVDILARRNRLSFLDTIAAKQALPEVLRILQEKLYWDDAKVREESERFFNYIFDHTDHFIKKKQIA